MKRYLVGYEEDGGVNWAGFATAFDATTAIRAALLSGHAHGEVKAWAFEVDDDTARVAKIETQVRVHSLEVA